MLGVFGDGSDSEDEKPRKQGRGGGGAEPKAPLAARPMSFVSAGKRKEVSEPPAPPAPPPAPKPKPPVMRAAFGIGSTSASAGASSAAAIAGEKVDKDFATFESTSKGFGSRMLEKMGWIKGQGIGKAGHGVVNPLESKLRPNSMGLGFGGFKETTAKAKIQQERILHTDSDRTKPASDDSDEDLARERRKQGVGGAGGGAASTEKRQYWKRHERRELNVKSAAELREEWTQRDVTARAVGATTGVAAGVGAVVDMRGPQTRIHSNVSTALASGGGEGMVAEGGVGGAAAPPEILPELRHNVRMYVDLAEVALDKQHRELRAEKETLASLTSRRDAQASAARQASARLHEAAALHQAVDDATSAARGFISRARAAAVDAAAAAAASANGGDGVTMMEVEGGGQLAPLEEAAAGWLRVRVAHPEGFDAWGLADVAASMVADPLRMAFRTWRPLRMPTYGVSLMRQWQLALGRPGGANTNGASTTGGHDNEGGVGGGSSAYDALVYLVVMPALRGALANEWQVRESDAAITLLEGWRGVLPDALWHTLFAAQVLPRLAAELSGWQPKSDPTPPHLWLHPWLPLLPPPGLAELFPQLRHKLATALGAADTAGAGGVALVAPWKSALDTASWHALVSRHVVPKLADSLAADKFHIEPSNQDVEPVVGVLRWLSAGVVPAEQMAALLVRSLFPLWLAALHTWLSTPPEWSELAQWYTGWRGLLTEHAPALLTNKAVRAQLRTALEQINAALDADGDQKEAQPPPPPPPRAARSAWEDDGDDNEAPPPPPPPAAPPPPRVAAHTPASLIGDDEISLRESLEQLAAVHDLVCMPTGGRHDGKLVYSFGPVPVYVDPDKKIVCARLGKAPFQPTSLAALVEAATAPSSTG